MMKHCLLLSLLAMFMMAMAVQATGGRSTDRAMARKLAHPEQDINRVNPKNHHNRNRQAPVKGVRRRKRERRQLGKVNPNSSQDKYDQAVAAEEQKETAAFTSPTGPTAGWSPPSGQTPVFSSPTGQIAQTPQSGNGGAGGFFGGGGGTTTVNNAAEGRTSSNSNSQKSKGAPKAPKSTTGTSANTVAARNSDAFATSALTTYDNKCDAAAAGAEFKTSSFVTVYYQYEVLTNPSRNILNLVDVVDNAIQDFLAVWIVDCDTTELFDDDQAVQDFGGRNRRLEQERRRLKNQQKMLQKGQGVHRNLQMTLAPIVGTGVGDWDTVLLDGNHPCQSLVPTPMMGQICYKVIGSVNVYLDESMYVTPADIRTLVLETLTVGMNYAATDFSMLDPDIQGLFFFQGYDAPPEDLLRANWEANQRPWDTTSTSRFATSPSKERSGGAKFGIAFATLLCIALAVLIGVYLYKNRGKLMGDDDEEWTSCFCCGSGRAGKPRRSPRKNNNKSHKQLEEHGTFYKHQQRKALGLYDEENDDEGDDEISFTETHATFRTNASSPANSNGRSTPPETPPINVSRGRGTPAYHTGTESNIVTPVSDWGGSTHSRFRNNDLGDNFDFGARASPDDRIRMSLSKDAIRGSSRKSNRTPTQHGEFLAPVRSYECGDTVDL